MSFLAVVAHGATGTWLDEFVELGIPLIVLVVLYWWSNRKPKPKEASATSDSVARSNDPEKSETK
jgi:hypothetical protein